MLHARKDLYKRWLYFLRSNAVCIQAFIALVLCHRWMSHHFPLHTVIQLVCLMAASNANEGMCFISADDDANFRCKRCLATEEPPNSTRSVFLIFRHGNLHNASSAVLSDGHGTPKIVCSFMFIPRNGKLFVLIIFFAARKHAIFCI